MAKQLKLYGPIVQEKVYDNDVTASEVKEFMDGLKSDEDLNIHINSGGGLVDVGLAIYNTIKAHKGYKTVYIDGFACSIASVIAFAGDKLIVPESAIMMIHLPYTGIVGNKLELQDMIKTLETLENSMMSIYTKNLRDKSDKQKIQDYMYAEKWFTGQEVADYFNATLQQDSTNEAAASNSVLSKFVKKNQSYDNAEIYKQQVLKKMEAAHKRVAKDERTRVNETKSVLTRLKKGV